MPSKKKKPINRFRPFQRSALIVFVLIFALIGAKMLFSSYAATAANMHIIATLYANPSSTDWAKLTSSTPTVRYAILDICAPDGTGSGCTGSPADAKNSSWVPVISSLKSAGITPLYYISTNYGAISTATIENEINNAITWYGIPSPMFDTMSTSNSCTAGFIPISCSSYYKTLYTYADGKGAAAVMYNPGTVPPSSYMFGSKVIMQVFEGTAKQFESATFPSWMQSYDASQFSATLASGTSSTITADINDTTKDNIGNFFENSEAEPPNYSSLPSFWSTEVSNAAAVGVSSPTPTPTPTPSPSPSPSPSPTPTTPDPGGSTDPSICTNPDYSACFGGTSDSVDTTGSDNGGDVSYANPGSDSPVGVSVDGVQISNNGTLDTTQLSNGKHTITITKNGKATKKVIYVNNKLSAFKRVRNYMYPELAGVPPIRDTATVLTLLAPFIITAVYLRKAIKAGVLALYSKAMPKNY